ncbi:MAG: hypothetical protein HQL84_10075 [Magnetococcales bacterium]|nr:hypothetical protein [Magnetococcales bacterium]MBF0150378.1 hypothetical protein [Magnetococcales bacterium]MBF0348595.1 hypothetical protein [Magnetococcales bacterium]MBF0631576.1 hypothetical protein [Magnetococcales bacterium]
MPYYGIIVTPPDIPETAFTLVGDAIPIEGGPAGMVGCYSAETRWSSQL